MVTAGNDLQPDFRAEDSTTVETLPCDVDASVRTEDLPALTEMFSDQSSVHLKKQKNLSVTVCLRVSHEHEHTRL